MGSVSLAVVEIEGMVMLVPDHPGVVFTTRLGGVSHPPFDSLNLGYATGDSPEKVDDNRARLSAALSLDPRWVTAHQVHSSGVLRADARMAGGPPPRPPGDAVVLEEPGVAAAVLTADCVPVALHSTAAVAAVHVGWRGLCAGIVDRACEALGSTGSVTGHPQAWIGPSIGVCHYEVGPEVPERFAETHPEAPDFTEEVDGSLRFDLREAVAWLLARAGVRLAGGTDVPCTFCDERFYSYRREGETGRQGVVVWR